MPLWGNTIANPPLALVENQKDSDVVLIDEGDTVTVSGTIQGWVATRSYTGIGGVPRVRQEVLVALADVPDVPETPAE